MKTRGSQFRKFIQSVGLNTWNSEGIIQTEEPFAFISSDAIFYQQTLPKENQRRVYSQKKNDHSL